MNKKIIFGFILAFVLAPLSVYALNPVGWDRYISGSGGAIRTLYNSNNDHVVVGESATSTTAQLEVSGGISAVGTATSSMANFRGMLDPTLFSGADEAAQVQTAYNQGSAGGVTVLMQPASFSTQIAATTNNKFLNINCALGGGAGNNGNSVANELLFTATVGTSTLFNTNNYIGGNMSGVHGCNLTGTNGTTARYTTGIDFDGSNGGFGGSITGTNVSGFGTGVALRPNTSFNILDQSAIHFNGRNINEPDTSGANCENMRISNSVIADANNQSGGATDLNGMYVQESGWCQWNIALTSFDDNQINFDQFTGSTNSNVNSFLGDHFENPNLDAYTMIVGNAGGTNNTLNILGGDMLNDKIAGQPDQIKVAGQVNLIGMASESIQGVTTPVTRVVNAAASSTAIAAIGVVGRGVNSSSFLYGNVPIGPLVIGSDYGQPSLYIATSTTQGIGAVGIATTSLNSILFGNSVLNLGVDSTAGISNSASSTIRYTGKGQMEMQNTAGATVCMFVVGTTPTVSLGTCNH